MAAKQQYIELRGDLKALLAVGRELVTVSVHPEGHAGAVCWIDTEKASLRTFPMPGAGVGGVALAADDAYLFVAGTDGHVHRCALKGGAVQPLTRSAFDPAPRDLVILSENRLAVLSGHHVVVLSRKNGKELQRLELPVVGTTSVATRAASDPTGTWLAVGSRGGSLVVFECEDKKTFVAAEHAKLHEGSITALLFERDDLRVLSVGADHRLLSTHVRGALEAEDRGGPHMHDEQVPALVDGRGERFHSCADDGLIKSWTWGKQGPSKQRPATTRDGVARGVGLAVVKYLGRPHLAQAGEDTTLRLFPLDAGGKVGELAVLFHGAIARARHESGVSEVGRREAALRRLAEYADSAAMDLLKERVGQEKDHALKVLATEFLGKSGHPRAKTHLEHLLKQKGEAVRRAAFEGLREIAGKADRRPLMLALKTRKADVGVLAIEALAELATRDDQARTLLTDALGNEPADVRFAALAALEKLGESDSPAALLEAMASSRADIRRRVLIRLHERGFLEHPIVQVVLRREDPDPDVRGVAFLVSVMSRPNLAKILRQRDPELDRKFEELETFGKKKAASVIEKLTGLLGQPLGRQAGRADSGVAGLESADVRPLLEAMASRALDTSLQGTWGLALLGDRRAFGALLQLSRDPQTSARVQAAKALEVLGDPRATDRLRRMLGDDAGEVRDAAFTALARLQADAPLETARAGLNAGHEDVRRRGLELLVRHLRKAKKGKEEALELLERTLNDVAPAVRGEAFKAVLSLGVFSGQDQEPEEGALRFARQSSHGDIRREILVEIEAQIQRPWAWPLLLELFEDPDGQLRRQAFEFAVKRSKGRELEPLAAALRSSYADLRLRATEKLTKKRTAGARQLLVEALDDDDSKVRSRALDALKTEGAEDALRRAMVSSHADVRLRAAVARAEVGDAEALAPLLALVTAPKPGTPEAEGVELEIEDPKVWGQRVEAALVGLAHLAHPDAVDAASALLDQDSKSIRTAAVRALTWCSRPGGSESGGTKALRQALRHAQSDVRAEAAQGLAYCGDAAGASMVFEGGMTGETLLAAVGLGLSSSAGSSFADSSSDRILAFLDQSDASLRERALLFNLMTAWAEGARPERCLAMLSAAHPRIRLTAARALEVFDDPNAFSTLVVEHFNDRGDHREPWKVGAAVVQRLAGLFLHQDPQLRVRTAMLLEKLDGKDQEHGEKKQAEEAFERAWQTFEGRFGEAFGAAPERQGASTEDDLRSLVFGAYVGLARLESGAAESRIRQSAIARLLALAGADPNLAESVRPVLVLALGDSQQSVRHQAFEGLVDLGTDVMSVEDLSVEALSSRHHDVGVLGLELLAKAVGKSGKVSKAARKKASDTLRRVMVIRQGGLEKEAWRLLSQQSGEVEASAAALEARSPELRREAGYALARLLIEGAAGAEKAGTEKAGAEKAIRQALKSRFADVRLLAAETLAGDRVKAAFPVLLDFLQTGDKNEQKRAQDALTELGDDRVPDALMDRVDNDPAGTARVGELLRGVGAHRQPTSVDRLLGYLDGAKTRRPAFDAVLTVSGHDQMTYEEVDSLAWKEEIAAQHPRRDDVLKRLLEAVYLLGNERLLRELIDPACLAQSPELSAALAPLAAHPKDAVRRRAVAALGWRLRKRPGVDVSRQAEPLVTALEHADGDTRFLAAEGLARADRSEGLAVLLASIEMLEQMDDRKRAVLSLGRLADPRALDPLLRLVDDEEHALREDAAEALGHMSQTEKGEQILRKLEGLAQVGEYGRHWGVALRALRGLRWFGSREAWQLILSRAEDSDAQMRTEACTLLGHWGDPAAREALEKRLRCDEAYTVGREAARSLRRLAGVDSLEPDYVILCCRFPDLEPTTVERLAEGGDAGRLLPLLAEMPDTRRDDRDALADALLDRDPLPLSAAAKALESADSVTVRVAASLLGRGGGEGASKHGKTLARVMQQTRERWIEALLAALRGDAPDGLTRLEDLTHRLSRLVWACGRLGAGAEEVVSLATGEWGVRVDGTPVEADARVVRRAALLELAEGLGDTSAMKTPVLEVLTAAASSRHADLRVIAADGLRRLAPKKAAGLVASSLDDPGTLAVLVSTEDDDGLRGGIDGLRGGIDNVHTQGVVLPHVLRQGDVEGLGAVASNRELPEVARLGALEGLARLGLEAAEKSLVAVGTSEEEEETLRKAAWRALRRSRRQRARQVKSPTSEARV